MLSKPFPGQLTGLYAGVEAAIKVTLQEGETKPYASFTSFTFSGIDSVSTITDTAENAGEVIVSVPEGTDVANLNAVYALDSYAEDFALTTDYTNPVTYVLDNGVNTKTYTVKVQVAPNVPTIPNYIMHADFTTDSLESLIADGWQLPSDTVDPQRGLLISAAQSTLLKAFPTVSSGQVSFEFKYYYVSGGGFDGWLQGSDNNEAIGMFLVSGGNFIHRNGEGTAMNSNGSDLNDGTFRSIRIDFDFDNGGLTKVYIDGNHAGPDIKSAKSDLARVQLGFKAGEFYMKEMGVYRMSKDIKAVANGGNFFFPDEQTEIDVVFTAPISPEFAGRITLTKDGEKIPATVKVTDGGKNVVIVPDEKLAYGVQYTIKAENVQDMYGNDVSQDIVLKTAGEGMVLYDSVSVDDLDTVMTFDEAGMLSATAQKDGQSVKLPAKWFSVTSSDDKILSVSAAADGYKLTGLKEGVVVLSVESNFYDRISGYKKIVYVTRNAREAANYTLTGATETTEGGNRIITTKQNAVISYSGIDGNFGEKNQKVRLVYANPGAATKATISIGGVSREVTLEKCYSKTDYRVSQAVFQLGKGANTADVSISSPDVKVAALAVVPAIDFAIINKAKADTVEAIFADILPALDLQDDFNKLPNSGKWSVMNAFVAKVSGGYAFDDADALHDYIKELIDKANDGQTGNDPKPERPGNSGSSNKNDKPINVPISPVPTPDWEEDTQQASKHFNDMNDTKWAVSAVDALFEKNIVTGKEDGKFAPGDTVTREEFVAMLVRLAGVFDANAVSQMTDVDQNAWYAPYVGSAVNAGLVNGMSETEFGVGQSISREQMAVMIYRAAQKLGVSLSGGEVSFTDMDAVSDYAKEAVLALAGAKIVNGLGDGSFAPGASATRAQSAQLLYNLLVLVDEGGAN